MTDCVFTSRTDVVTYVAEMATELARLAGAAQCDRLAYLLQAAATEAKNTAVPSVGEDDPPDEAVPHRTH
jgi:hypothetical protein